jgi:hypothetical protein
MRHENWRDTLEVNQILHKTSKLPGGVSSIFYTLFGVESEKSTFLLERQTIFFEWVGVEVESEVVMA